MATVPPIDLWKLDLFNIIKRQVYQIIFATLTLGYVIVEKSTKVYFYDFFFFFFSFVENFHFFQ